MRICAVIFAAFFLISVSATSAQNVPPPPFCENNTEFRQFDFWLGAWDVTDNATGKHAGVNRIEKVEKDCLIMEHWTSDGGGTGRSINYYNAVTGKWRQVWISNGYSVDYEGGLNDAGAMVLVGEIFNYRAGKSSPFRGTWTPGDDGSVRQFFEQYNAETGAWGVWFDGKYVRKAD